MKYHLVLFVFQGLTLSEIHAEVRKHIVYIRHVESTWNKAKADGDYSRFLGEEYKDALLSDVGVIQAQNLGMWVKGMDTCSGHMRGSADALHELIYGSQGELAPLGTDSSAFASCSPLVVEILNDKSRFVWASSNLRRALLTAVYTMGFSRENPDRHPLRLDVLSCLQELEDGIDARASTPKYSVPDIGWQSLNLPIQTISTSVFEKGWFGSVTARQTTVRRIPWINARGNLGDYNEWGIGKEARFEEFCAWAKSNTATDTLVVVGHSSWLQKFFISAIGDIHDMNMAEALLSYSGAGKKVKLDNAGVVEFVLDVDECRFVPKSTQLVYGSWSIKDDVFTHLPWKNRLSTGHVEHLQSVGKGVTGKSSITSRHSTVLHGSPQMPSSETHADVYDSDDDDLI